MKRILAILILLLIGAQSLLAQDVRVILPDEAVDIPRVLSVIESVEIEEEEGQPVLLIFGVMPDGCERDTLVTKERQGDVLFVDVYHEPLPPSGTACPKKLIPISLTLLAEELLALDENATLPTLLVVNDKHFAIHIAAIEPMPDAGLPPMMLSPLTRTDLRIEEVILQAHDEGVDVTIKGFLPEGCPDPVHSRVTALPDQNSYVVQLFRAMEDPMMCPLTYVAVPFEKTVTTPADPSVAATFLIEETSYAYDPSTPGTGENAMRVPHVIESVDALLLESFPVQIMLQVKGYQSDGCEMPVMVEQSREGNTVTVEIYRELSPDTACPAVIKEYEGTIKLDGGFEPGTYTIDVNGTVITVTI